MNTRTNKYKTCKYKGIPQTSFKKQSRKMGPKQYRTLVYIINYVQGMIDEAEYLDSLWFYSPRHSRSWKNWFEDQHKNKWEWIENGRLYTAEFSVECHGTYYKKYTRYTVDGKETNRRSARASLDRMIEEREYQDRRRQEDTNNG